MPQISVIVPVYKVEQYLPRCIDSILAQTFTDFECILIDDGSPDNCPAICDEYAARDSRIRVIHQENAGQAAARNHALDIAAGVYIAFIDSDDVVSPEFLRIMFHNLQIVNGDIAVCSYKAVYDLENIQSTPLNNIPHAYSGREFLKHCMFDGVGKHWLLWDKLYRRSCFNNIRLPEGRLHKDNATVYRLLYDANKVVDSDAFLYFYNQRPGSTVHTFSWKKIQDYILMWEEMCTFFQEKGDTVLHNKALNSTFYALLDVYPDRKQYPEIPRSAVTEHRRKVKTLKKLLEQDSSITPQSCPVYYNKLYPRVMKLYWFTKAVRHKLMKSKE